MDINLSSSKFNVNKSKTQATCICTKQRLPNSEYNLIPG